LKKQPWIYAENPDFLPIESLTYTIHTDIVGIVNENKTTDQAELLFNRLSKRYRHLKKWARRLGINSFRLYDRDIPEIPLVLDLYDDAVSGALYKRPYEKDDDEEKKWLLAMKESTARSLDIRAGNIFIKVRQRMRSRQDTGTQYGRMSAQNFFREAKEGDLAFRVNLSDYLDTGLFLDARKKRALIRRESAGKKVLNLFAYTSTLSVAAASGGARQVDSVDLSKTYLDWGKANFALNGMEARYDGGRDNYPAGPDRSPVGIAYSLIRSDVIRFITHAAGKKLRWDLIILDPPSFSNSKKMSGVLDLRRDHRELIRNCLPLLSPGGTLWFSSNKKGLALDSADYPGYDLKDISSELIDEDFRGKRNPLCIKFSEMKNPAQEFNGV